VPALDKLRRGVGDGAGPCGRADLVVHDVQAVAFLQQTLNGQQEVFAVLRIHPTGTQNQVRAADSGNCLFASQFATPVNAQWVEGVSFVVRSGFTAVKHVIGGVVDQRCAQFRSGFSQDAGCCGVDCKRQFWLAFGLVHGCVRGCINDQRRALLQDLLADLMWFCQVELFAAQHRQFNVAAKRLL